MYAEEIPQDWGEEEDEAQNEKGWAWEEQKADEDYLNRRKEDYLRELWGEKRKGKNDSFWTDSGSIICANCKVPLQYHVNQDPYDEHWYCPVCDYTLYPT